MVLVAMTMLKYLMMMELGMVPPLEGRDAAIFPIFRENSSTIASNAPFLMQFLQ